MLVRNMENNLIKRRASRDGDHPINFHHGCDVKGRTILLAKSSTGNVFGAYFNSPWRGLRGMALFALLKYFIQATQWVGIVFFR